jgi:hypothetical protein|uniref:Uncharacterized protein n=1 Tax=Myoviridae sp. ctuim2 TaxID=2827717 RepID=A0A8S5SDH4_9CAUD|nr:MAG TPA: hypothetical protein [Myoviridae sp. ctuim2]
MEDKITILNIDISDKKDKDILRESLNFLSTICRIKLSDNQIEELLTGKLIIPFSDFILFFKVYTAWYSTSIVKLWIMQGGHEYLYIFKNKEYQITP